MTAISDQVVFKLLPDKFTDNDTVDNTSAISNNQLIDVLVLMISMMKW